MAPGVRVVPPDGSISGQDILLVAGEQVEYEKIIHASRMTRAVVVFMEDENFVYKLVENSLIIRDHF